MSIWKNFFYVSAHVKLFLKNILVLPVVALSAVHVAAVVVVAVVLLA